mmetsp:Transcript_10113/g.26518  ORF Transcript_10113/g.26518 Transcript_10113/m.26518 type:complete len:98 (-) Transcript_10113:139-432(-)
MTSHELLTTFCAFSALSGAAVGGGSGAGAIDSLTSESLLATKAGADAVIDMMREVAGGGALFRVMCSRALSLLMSDCSPNQKVLFEALSKSHDDTSL